MTNPDRVAFTLFGKDIYWYGILMAAGIVLAVILAQFEEKRKKLPKDIIIDLCLVVIPAGVIGARLYYVLFELQEYLADPIRILYIWEGGLAIYGAVIGGLIALFFFARARKVRFLALADCVAPGLVLAQGIGRWGNFFNQEAFGLPITADMLAKFPILNYFPFSVSLDGAHYFDGALCTACVTAANGGHMHLATFFYESFWCLLIFAFIMLMRRRFKHDGDSFVWYALLYSFERMFVEGLRADSLWLIRPGAEGFGGIRVSQLLSAVMFLLAAAFLIVRAIREKKLGRLVWPSPLEVSGEEGEPAPDEAAAEGDDEDDDDDDGEDMHDEEDDEDDEEDEEDKDDDKDNEEDDEDEEEDDEDDGEDDRKNE
ncbi:MAG: Prolipoprotein diacylglyceryl transferase [Firmicutes bacterium ADurb.Bin248]|jgi:phosphatidylglycerol:prolipoprotein diacylglycerol transferase|nr:MAG: Prolipoprotein diacylglyceryl transferase [Firmicutes bacterium ADurb.Bin248]HOG00090.1 prolipoprotein diacylglyceryl transferase [Clostridia bacterium]